MSQQISSPPKASSLPAPSCIETVVHTQRDLSWQVASNLFVSFKYAWCGISYAFQTQRNFRIHIGVGALAIGLSVFLHLKSVEIAVIGLTSGLVLALELLNTAIESIVDLTVKQTYHELAKIAKDCAAGAVLVSALVAVIVAAVLLLPPLFALVLASISP
ncbi:diacylglycerol kinase family protein [Brasilonema sp. UFV-L1]|uniref:diacylglycerol kinase family protein n=1 Tax=Brasilonema sp. UFV-L1 TaxID=2234130 RepID=UPI00145D45AE|nr:diacylglycerol kinase family protein [Brasilonema sp. UFV-L1]NMG05701.1 diacylglycerol kinase family protein [Brasilonema sp. UFV-L1]